MAWAKIKASLADIKLVAAQPSNFELSTTEQCVFTFAKAYYRGGGWWLISGYDPDGEDVQRVVERLNIIQTIDWNAG